MDYSNPRKKRPRRRIGIPKGMLRHITLKILMKESMSGIELMDEVEYYTDWRPSPGSVYPLLSKLEEQRLITLVESDDPTLKRYALTKTGSKAVEEQRKLEPVLRSRYYIIQKIYWKLVKGMDETLFDNYLRLLTTIEGIYPFIKNKPEASRKVQKLLLDSTKEIDTIKRQLEDSG